MSAVCADKSYHQDDISTNISDAYLFKFHFTISMYMGGGP